MVCLDYQQLEAFARGEMRDVPHGSVESHLTSCAACRSRLTDVNSNLAMLSTVAEALRQVDTPTTIETLSHVDHYDILEEIGRGAMGVVYRAMQKHPRREVAIKILRPDVLSEQARRRFELEVQALAHISDPGVAHVYDAGVTAFQGAGGEVFHQPYLVMEYVRGERLDDAMTSSLMNVERSLKLLANIADAVHAAHVKGIIHRDLKPANILVVASPRDSDTFKAKILDFGVARLLEDALPTRTMHTCTTDFVGTLPYMSAEQIGGDPTAVDARSDVYALGVIGFEMLSGRLPFDFDGKSMIDAARMITDCAPLSLRSAAPRLERDMEIVISRALAKESGQRYQSAAEFAADIRRIVHREPIVARPANAMYQFTRFVQRNRPLVTSVVSAVAALVVALVIAVQQATEAHHAQKDSERRFAEAIEHAEYLRSGIASRLGAVVGTREIRRDIVESVASFYRGIIEDYPTDPMVLCGFAKSLHSLAGHHNGEGDVETALELYTEAFAAMRRSFELAPNESKIRHEFGRFCRSRAERRLAEGACQAALEDTERACAILQPLADALPPFHMHMIDVSRAHRVHGQVLLRMDDVSEAARSADHALQLATDLYERDTTPLWPPLYQKAMIEACLLLSDIANHTDDLDRALEHTFEAVRIGERLVTENDENPRNLTAFADALVQRSQLQLRQNWLDEAYVDALQALSIHETLATAEPGKRAHFLNMASCLIHLSTIESKRGHQESANDMAVRAQIIRAGIELQRAVAPQQF